MIMTGGVVSACAPQITEIESPIPGSNLPPEVLRRYDQIEDDGRIIPAVNPAYLKPHLVRQEVPFDTSRPVDSIVVDPFNHALYLVLGGGRALRYGVAVGDAGRNFRGGATISRKQHWPSWTPTANMIRREPNVYGPFAGGVPGGLDNPLGARALYLYRNGRDTYYRIHGTSQPWSIGMSVSSGCIRLYNQDIIDLYERVPNGTRVHVMSRTESDARFAQQSAAMPGEMDAGL
ncbi:L,D-transpeptidase (plasmid) [Qingshengfaniella alkalisoli]|uniref:L,D-transpeptidase n=2 Tax=Qingshengfaniella alkalisoli TaxID=2599296 RepID=A0A5B8IB11_9RHOB|nr:L,D-transpeptidase [Qingshengfaniella alkalisoli]